MKYSSLLCFGPERSLHSKLDDAWLRQKVEKLYFLTYCPVEYFVSRSRFTDGRGTTQGGVGSGERRWVKWKKHSQTDNVLIDKKSPCCVEVGSDNLFERVVGDDLLCVCDDARLSDTRRLAFVAP
eukprot:scaffold34597_cov177-Amphora_coffeaeformis.AAC.34